MGYQRFATVRDDEDEEEIVQPPAAKLAEVERRFEQADSGYGSVSVADFEEGIRSTTLSVTLAGGRVLALALTYDPNVMTESASIDIQEMAEDNPLATAVSFCELVKSWQMKGPLTARKLQYDGDAVRYDDRGLPVWAREEIVPAGAIVPLDPRVIQYMQTPILVSIWREINREVNLDPKEKKHLRNKLRRR